MDTPKDPADRIRSDDNTRLSDATRAPTTTTSTQGDVSVATKGNNERRGTSVAVPVLAESSADADPSASGQSGLTGTPRHIGTTSTAQVVSTSSPAPAPTSPAVGSPVSTNVTPTIKLTPATPDTTHFASHRPTSTAPAPAAVNSDKMASTTTPAGGASSTTTTAKPTSTPASAPTATAGPSTTTTTPTSTAKGTKPKRKRTGFNKFLAAFGCLSAHDLEDDPATVAKREAALNRREKEKEAAAATPPSTGATKVASADARQVDGEGAQTEKDGAVVGTGAGTGGNTLSDASEAEKGVMGTGAGVQNGPTGEVVVPPSEPTSPPLAETAGLTSGAVQPPGSGAELLHQTPSKSSMHRRDSEASVSAGAVSPTGTLVNAGTVAAAGVGAGVVAGTETLQHEESDRSGDDSQDGDDEQDDQDMDHMYQYQDEYEEEDRLIAQGGMGIPTDELGRPAPLLPALDKAHIGRKCLVLDLDETLLHSSFKMLSSADYIVPVEIESQVHNVYVIKRPGVDKFLTEMGKIYEIVVFTASLSKYADPVLDMLDPNGVVKHRLFRESCYNHKGNYVKDLSQLGRTMETCIIIDNSPASYIFHPNNAVPVSTWFNDPHDTELTDLCPFLTDLSEVDDIRGVLDGSL